MKVDRLKIEQQFAQIQINSTMAGLSIETHRRGMRVEHQRARMSVERTPGSVKLDMKSYYRNIGLESAAEYTDNNVRQAYSDAQQGIQRIVSEGNQIGTLPGNGKQIAQVASNRMIQNTLTNNQSGGSVPAGAIKMEGDPGSLNINWQRYDMRISWDPFESPSITVEPKPSVRIEMLQEPKVEISVVEDYIELETGKNIDTEI